VALYCNGANAIFTALPRIFGMPVALNVTASERKRKKWNRLAKAWYLVPERLPRSAPRWWSRCAGHSGLLRTALP